MTEPHDDQLSPVDGVPPPGLPENFSGDLNDTDPEEIRRAPSLPPGGQPAAFPDTDALQAVQDLQRAALAQPAGNVIRDAPHFLRNVDGDEVCGQDGKPWPCPEYQAIERRNEFLAVDGPGTGRLPEAIPTPPTMAEAAAAAGVDVEVFAARLDAMRRR